MQRMRPDVETTGQVVCYRRGLADNVTALTRVLRSLYMYDYSAARLSWISATFTDLG